MSLISFLRRPDQNRRGQSGFTLIEIVTVMVILGVLGAVAYQKANQTDFNIRNGVKVIASDILSTQMEAMNRHKRLSLSFQTGVSTYSYGDGLSRDLTSINSAYSIGTGQTITFNSRGEPVGITAPVTISITSGSSTSSLTLQPYTGKVTVL